MSSFGLTTQTGLSRLLNGKISHDRIQRFLSKESKTGKKKRRSPITKNEHYRHMLRQVKQNQILFLYVLNDV